MQLTKNTAHIWLVNLDEISINYAVLSDTEKNRASKMHFPQPRHRTAAARYVLHILLKKYLSSLSPLPYSGEARVRATDKGKLFLADSELKFNLAHSGSYAIYAFSLNCDVGVDIEQQRDNIEFDGIAKRVMSAQEYDYWSQLTPEKQNELFFKIWCRKEALIKCTGDGLSGPLKDLSTIDTQGNICSIVNYADQAQLHLTDLSAPQNYYAALASAPANGQSLQLCCYPLQQAEIFSVGS